MTITTPLILFFADIRAADLPLVGGKGANLGEMNRAGFPIPDRFCLTTAAFYGRHRRCWNSLFTDRAFCTAHRTTSRTVTYSSRLRFSKWSWLKRLAFYSTPVRSLAIDIP